MNGRALSAVLGLLAAASSARADEGFDLSPLLAPSTVLVARVDLAAVKLPAAVEWLTGIVGRAKLPADLTDATIASPAREAASAQAVLDRLTAAGVTRVALVVDFDHADARPRMLFVTPRITDAVVRAAALPPMNHDDVGGLTVWTAMSTNDGQYALRIKPAPRPDLAAAASPAGGPVVAVAMAVSDAERTAVAALPANAPVSEPTATPWAEPGVRLALLRRLPDAVSPLKNVHAATLRLDLDAGPHLAAAVDADDPKAVEQAFHAVGTGAAADLAQAIPVTSAGRTTSVDLRQPEMDTLVAAARPALELAHQQALRIQSMTNLRSLMQATMIYAAENHGVVAPSFDALGKYLNFGKDHPPKVLTNPQHPELGPAGYVYVPAKEGKVARIRPVADRLAMYEAGDFGEGVAVAFWDGHVEFVNDRPRFDRLLAESGSTPAQP